MKKFNLSLVAVLAMSTFAVAGGDIAPVEPVVETPVIEEASTGAFYIGMGYSAMYSDVTNIRFNDGYDALKHDVEHDTGAIMLDAGYKFNDYFAVEARYWIGFSDDSVSFNNDDYTFHGDVLDSDSDAWGVYAKPMYPVTDAFDIYGLLGYGSASLNDGAFNKDVEGISWGVGAAYSFTESFSVFLDYVAFTEDTLTNNSFAHVIGIEDTTYDHSFDTINFGLNYQF